MTSRTLRISLLAAGGWLVSAAACDRNPASEGPPPRENPPAQSGSSPSFANDPHAGIPNAPRLDPHAGVPNAPPLNSGASHGSDPHAGIPNAPPLGPGGGAPHGGDPHAGVDMGSPTPTSAPTGTPAAGGLTWTAPESFARQTPASSMRAAEYIFRSGDGAATLTVFFFGAGQGGSVQANLDRWIGQFVQPDGTSSADAAETTRLQVNGLDASIVDVNGTFVGGGMTPGAPTATQPDQRMLAAIVEGPSGPVFFKMVGAQSLMQSADAPFRALIQTVRSQ